MEGFVTSTTWISIILSMVQICTAHHFFEPGTIHFPLRDVRQSINLDTFSTSERNLTVGKCEHVSNQRVVLNLPNLEMPSPLNPYPGFIESSHATCLNLASNEISQIVPGSFDSLPNLGYLDLSRNRIQFCDFFNFGTSHRGIVTLVVEDNKPPVDNIDRVVSKADCFPQLRYLYLRRNSLRGLNFSLKRAFPALTHLFLSDNNVDSNNFIRDLPASLAHLHLERNLISELDCKVMRSLESLRLDDNIIRAICYHKCEGASLKLQGVHKLSTLTASQNRISQVESCAFQEATALAVLNLAGNDIEELQSETFERLTVLRELNLDDNRLSTVPNLCNSDQLTSVSLKRNKLRAIRRETFKNKRVLKFLRLAGNEIVSIEAGSFEDLESLTELDLSYNRLDFIPTDWLKWQQNLRILDVRGNRFKCLEQMSLSVAPFLNTIYMQNNPVTHISGSIVSKFSPSVVIHLKNDCGGESPSARSRTDCYEKCDSDEVEARNETYSRWINNL